MTLLVDFVSYGRPITKGSWTPQVRCVPHNRPRCSTCTLDKGTHVHMAASDAMRAWERQVAVAAQAAYYYRRPHDGPVRVSVAFYYVRPAGNPDPFPTAKGYGDYDKLLRLASDALTKGGVVADDRLIQGGTVDKHWGSAEMIRCQAWAL